MENKKLLKFLLKDLNELEELISEKKENSFDELEMEFLQTRVSGAKRMIQILFDRETLDRTTAVEPPETVTSQKEEKKGEEIIEVKAEEPLVKEEKTETEEAKTEPIIIERETEDAVVLKEPEPEEEPTPAPGKESTIKKEGEEKVKNANHRLGDSFTKEKSVNDLIDNENSNLEHKLSNRPVESIKKSIGINDRFQYIRELFEGNAERFVDAVTKLDEKKNMNEAVDYLKQNFKWQKNETSLKFINLVKRRFTNE